MSDNDDKKPENNVEPIDFDTRFAHLTEEQKIKAIKSTIHSQSRAALRKLFPNAEWELPEQVMQEVVSRYVIQDPNRKIPATAQLVEDYKVLVEEKYGEDPQVKDLLLKATPSVVAVRKWMQHPKWDEAVWSFIKNLGLFTAERRSAMINALYMRGMEKDTQAAKIWLQLSGDFIEKSEVTTNDTIEKYREINQILHKKS